MRQQAAEGVQRSAQVACCARGASGARAGPLVAESERTRKPSFAVSRLRSLLLTQLFYLTQPHLVVNYDLGRLQEGRLF